MLSTALKSSLLPLASLFAAYFALMILLAIPFFQTQLLFLHNVRFPLFAKFDEPERYGLAPGKTLNFKLTTSDNVTLGAWFVFSDSYYQSQPLFSLTASSRAFPSDHLTSALKMHPTILFLHGNAVTRATAPRVRHYAAFSARLRANVLAVDYRGFADSVGSPSEAGLAHDARAAWDWLLAHGAPPGNVLLVGHSLGTAVAARLGAELSAQGVEFKGLTLLAPFLRITTLLEKYYLGGFLPLVVPLTKIPGGKRFIAWFIVDKFDTEARISSIGAPILLVHAQNDQEIPPLHSEMLFDTLLETINSAEADGLENANTLERACTGRAGQAREGLVNKLEIHNFGSFQEFTRQNGWRVGMLKTEVGGHNTVGTVEGVQDVMRFFFHL